MNKNQITTLTKQNQKDLDDFLNVKTLISGQPILKENGQQDNMSYTWFKVINLCSEP
ncbi:MAG: hypothetical protein IPP49_03270 [Saprospiraceae bacterium]|nr:hypothetical protein [Saprospiraceae bacterium]